jgi:hypothetical protein
MISLASILVDIDAAADHPALEQAIGWQSAVGRA